jgi:spermidine synthase
MPTVLAGVIVFGASAAILVLEILAVRLLAPFMGITLETTTAVIGTVLAGIALGTWLGGRAADQSDPRRLLGPVLIVGGVLAIAVIPLIDLAVSLRLRPDAGGVVTVTALAFFAPAAVLAAASPIVVKLQLRSLGETGSVVGRLSALGTAGAILGTFVTGFVLVSALPTRPIVIGVGLVLIGAGVLVAATVGRARGPWVAGLALLAGGLALAWTTTSPERCQRESAYFCINVAVDADGQGAELRMDTLRHAYVDLADPTWLEFAYTRLFGDVIDGLAPAGEPIDALHIGGGGFTMPRYIAATRPGSDSRVLELDPVVLRTAREQLGLVTGDALEVVVGDGRVSLAAEPDDAYDLVVGDAFAGPAVPWHLTTRELIADVQRVLRPDGIYVLNVIDYPPLALARAELATMGEVFEHVAFIGPSSRIRGETGGNLVLMASDAPFPEEAIRAANRARGGDDELVTDRGVLDGWIADAMVLTDDHAPTDQLLTRFG